jgi:hypothetical protein
MVLAKFADLPAAQVERFGALDAGKFLRFAALDAGHVKAFAEMPKTGFDRFAGLDGSAFNRMAAMAPDVVTALGAMPEPAFGRFAALSPAELRRFSTLDGPTWTRFGELSDPAFQRYVRLPPANFERFSGMSAEGLKAFGDLATPLFIRFSQLSGPRLAAFDGLEAAVLEKYAGACDTPAMLERFGDAGQTAVKNLAGLDGKVLNLFARIDLNALKRFGALEPATVAKFDKVPHNGLEKLGTAADTPALKNLGTALDDKTVRALALLDNTGIARLAALPEAQLGKLNGVGPSGLKKAAALPAGALETRTATQTPEQLKAGLGEDAASLAQAKADAQALDWANPVNPNQSGHGNQKHGEQTIDVDPLLGMSPQERRLRTGIPPGGTTPQLNPNTGLPVTDAGAFASDALQVEAARAAEQLLQARLNTKPTHEVPQTQSFNGSTPAYPLIDLPGAGYTYKLEGATWDATLKQYVGGRMIEEQCDKVIAAFRIKPNRPAQGTVRSASDYYLITIYPKK